MSHSALSQRLIDYCCYRLLGFGRVRVQVRAKYTELKLSLAFTAFHTAEQFGHGSRIKTVRIPKNLVRLSLDLVSVTRTHFCTKTSGGVVLHRIWGPLCDTGLIIKQKNPHAQFIWGRINFQGLLYFLYMELE